MRCFRLLGPLKRGSLQWATQSLRILPNVGPKMALRWPQDGPSRPQEAPIWSKLAEDGPKKPPRGAQHGQQALETLGVPMVSASRLSGPRWPKMASRWPQNGPPRWPHDRPKLARKSPQDGPTSAPRWPGVGGIWAKPLE